MSERGGNGTGQQNKGFSAIEGGDGEIKESEIGDEKLEGEETPAMAAASA